MVILIEAVAIFESQAEGIVLAKSKGKYKGSKPTARAKQAKVRELLVGGMSKSQMAKELGISLSNVYRIEKENV